MKHERGKQRNAKTGSSVSLHACISQHVGDVWMQIRIRPNGIGGMEPTRRDAMYWTQQLSFCVSPRGREKASESALFWHSGHY